MQHDESTAAPLLLIVGMLQPHRFYSCQALAAQASSSYMSTCSKLLVRRLIQHDPSAAAPLRLIVAMLQLHEAPLAPPPFMRSSTGGFRAAKQPQDLLTARGKGEYANFHGIRRIQAS